MENVKPTPCLRPTGVRAVVSGITVQCRPGPQEGAGEPVPPKLPLTFHLNCAQH